MKAARKTDQALNTRWTPYASKYIRPRSESVPPMPLPKGRNQKMGEGNQTSGKRSSGFRSTIEKMLAELKIQYSRDDLQFINLRNKVVHTGELGKTFRETWGTYANLICLLDRILVRILRYQGEYLDYADQWRLM